MSFDVGLLQRWAKCTALIVQDLSKCGKNDNAFCIG